MGLGYLTRSMSSRLERELDADELAPGAALVPFEYDMMRQSGPERRSVDEVVERMDTAHL